MVEEYTNFHDLGMRLYVFWVDESAITSGLRHNLKKPEKLLNISLIIKNTNLGMQCILIITCILIFLVRFQS